MVINIIVSVDSHPHMNTYLKQVNVNVNVSYLRCCSCGWCWRGLRIKAPRMVLGYLIRHHRRRQRHRWTGRHHHHTWHHHNGGDIGSIHIVIASDSHITSKSSTTSIQTCVEKWRKRSVIRGRYVMRVWVLGCISGCRSREGVLKA